MVTIRFLNYSACSQGVWNFSTEVLGATEGQNFIGGTYEIFPQRFVVHQKPLWKNIPTSFSYWMFYSTSRLIYFSREIGLQLALELEPQNAARDDHIRSNIFELFLELNFHGYQ